MVITNLLSTIPLIGADFIFLLWGGFSIHDATLDRFYALHFIFPILMLIVLYFHLFFLHEFGSNNPLGVVSVIDNIFFSPYYVLKDFFSLLVLLSFVFYIVYKMPDLLGHPLNYEKANPLITPSHIVPE
jgi:quinol-cytochrome oxidoreductase complex cytochrome b subunit